MRKPNMQISVQRASGLRRAGRRRQLKRGLPVPVHRGYVAVLIVPSTGTPITLLFEGALTLDELYHMLHRDLRRQEAGSYAGSC
ncbi:hypothetical protein Alg215_11208 [Pyrenophora tritici-repentis]|nr:hypothetical protein Alg215_11208 [Pyrenophora tritici-repentis]